MPIPYQIIDKQVELLVYWITERHKVYLARKAKQPKPWTKDSILQGYRFCNPYRENDKVTKWLAKHWREPHDSDVELWFAMLVARYINEPTTLETIGYPVPWKPRVFLAAVEARKAIGETVYNAAYIISTGGQAKPKHLYLNEFFTGFWKMKESIRPKDNDTLASFNERLVAVKGMGTFFSGQIIADLKYAKGGPLRTASDWWSFAVSGPGSRRGLNRVCGNPVDQSWKEGEWHATLSALRRVVNQEIIQIGYPKLHAQDMQNCLCEFDKWSRVKLGEGKPKQKFPGK